MGLNEARLFLHGNETCEKEVAIWLEGTQLLAFVSHEREQFGRCLVDRSRVGLEDLANWL